MFIYINLKLQLMFSFQFSKINLKSGWKGVPNNITKFLK